MAVLSAVLFLTVSAYARLSHFQMMLGLNDNRQHREVADVEMSRLSSQLEAARAAAAAASGQAGQAEAAANAKLEATLRKQVQVQLRAAILLCRRSFIDLDVVIVLHVRRESLLAHRRGISILRCSDMLMCSASLLLLLAWCAVMVAALTVSATKRQ
jgi:hypothetical protein